MCNGITHLPFRSLEFMHAGLHNCGPGHTFMVQIIIVEVWCNSVKLEVVCEGSHTMAHDNKVENSM